MVPSERQADRMQHQLADAQARLVRYLETHPELSKEDKRDQQKVQTEDTRQRMRDVAVVFYDLCGMDKDSCALERLESQVCRKHAWGSREAVRVAVDELAARGYVKRVEDGHTIMGLIFE
mmetsp:Transcript_42406/g.70518  ORF Transcript_42406/g.70518 Transcript_42406/m.70518 type:complete len:120 (+) Transcript_42406:55-414(+)|eukprot:CAMPEP_0119311528 /NCGR_PEP_ID=MMETSP1333-20130426/22750_1 /TAXON_ID=418940 /ORGANISM="Scyphosphaera apsteinii, Strain RCC1455" /LENGTH=119 /DNA_ID=CAMNT_0007315927 /DNA_START=55 /DNA_END=414 /DNA_ORIENTATION=-